MSTDLTPVTIIVNGRQETGMAAPRLLLSDFLRQQLGLTGVHVGCEHGVCGACTVLLDGAPVRSCLMFAVQISGAEITTIEGLVEGDTLHPVQEAFRRNHGLQCGFCTPGMVLTSVDLLARSTSTTPTPYARRCREISVGARDTKELWRRARRSHHDEC